MAATASTCWAACCASSTATCRTKRSSPFQRLRYSPRVQSNESGGPFAALEVHISAERYLELLAELADAVGDLPQRPDAIIGIKRSGLFPAVYLSEVLQLPMFTDYEAQKFPWPRLSSPLVVDTVAWSGGSIRHALRQLGDAGAQQAQVLVMYARCDPAPGLEAYASMVDRIRYLYQAHCIPHFWYTRKALRLGHAKKGAQQ